MVDRMNPALRERWIIANTLGFALGGALGGHLARLLEQPYVGIRSAGKGALVLAMGRRCRVGRIRCRRRPRAVARPPPMGGARRLVGARHRCRLGSWGCRCWRPLRGDRWGGHGRRGRLRHVGLRGRRGSGRRGDRLPTGRAPGARGGSRCTLVGPGIRRGACGRLGGGGAGDPVRGQRPRAGPSIRRGLWRSAACRSGSWVVRSRVRASFVWSRCDKVTRGCGADPRVLEAEGANTSSLRLTPANPGWPRAVS